MVKKLRYATQEVWKHIPTVNIKKYLKAGKWPSGHKIQKRERYNARVVLKERKK